MRMTYRFFRLFVAIIFIFIVQNHLLNGKFLIYITQEC